MPTLDWIGKSKVVNHHLDVPYKTLERQYSFDKDGQHTEDNGSENMIIHGDNLEALKSLLPQYEGRIKYIYCCLDLNSVQTLFKLGYGKFPEYMLQFNVYKICK